MFSMRDVIRRLFSKKPNRGHRARPRLTVEVLETRQLLSTFSLSNAGVLTQGTTQVDQNVSSFQTDGAGDLFELKTNGVLWELPAAGQWTQLDVNVGNFKVNTSGELVEVKANGALWINPTPPNTGTWSQAASNVSEAGIDDLGNVYYLSENSNFYEWGPSSGATQINAAGYGVLNFQMGGTGNEQVYYQYGSHGSPGGDGPLAIFDWSDHSATNPYGIYVQGAIYDAGASGYTSTGSQYAVGLDGDLYIVGEKSTDGVKSDRVLQYAPSANPVTTSLFQATDTGTPLTIYDLAESPDKNYLFFTASNSLSVYLERFDLASAASTPPTQLAKFTGTASQTIYFSDLQVGGDDSVYALKITLPTGTSQILNETLIGAAVTANVASPVDTKVSLTTSTPYVVAPNGNVMVIETGGKLLNYNVATGSSGFVEDSSGATQIGFDSNGVFFELKNNGNFWALAGGYPWEQVDSGVTEFQTVPNGALYELKSNGNFWVYTGPGSTTTNPVGWTLIATDVSSFLAMDGGFAPAIIKNSPYDFSAFYSSDGQIVYDAYGSLFLLYPSLYNPNGSFQITDGGAYNPYILQSTTLYFGLSNELDWSSVGEPSVPVYV